MYKVMNDIILQVIYNQSAIIVGRKNKWRHHERIQYLSTHTHACTHTTREAKICVMYRVILCTVLHPDSHTHTHTH